MGVPLLRMVGIKKSFPGVQALKGVDLELCSGEVLALIGANGAGKSTLMNVLGGVITADEGDIYIQGERVSIRSPLNAAKLGIAFVHQETALMPTMTVAENMRISDFPTRMGLIDVKSVEEDCVRVLSRFGVEISPRALIRDLSPGERQMVEIGRALLGEARIIIFDEPTSSLTGREKTRLFEVIGSLKRAGVAIIYITHFLDEVFEVCERAIVLRDGETVGGGMLRDLTRGDIVRLMVGDKEITRYKRRKAGGTGEPVMRVHGLSRRDALDNISFTLHKGEILGLWGLLGSGRTELARACVGLDPIDKGIIEIEHNGVLKPIHPREAKSWIGMVTENRREEGLLLPMSVKANISLANLRALISHIWPFIDSRREAHLARDLVRRLDISVSSLDQAVETLSGGNQQKVVIARWLERGPSIYIMDEPTRGLDVRAKAEIRNIVMELADRDAAVLLISSEIEELMGLADRFLVMSRGRIVAEYPADASTEDLMAAAAGVH